MKKFLFLFVIWILALGRAQAAEKAPDFSLPDVVTGQVVSLNDFSEKKALLVAVICRHCPYVKHVKAGLAQLGRDYAGKDLAIVALSANDPAAYPDDAPARLAEMAVEEGFNFPLLFDESQQTVRQLAAYATPEFYLYDKNRELVYHGQFDDSRPGSGIPVTGKDVRAALDTVLNDQPVSSDQKPAVGCSIKWKPGNEPKS